MVRTYFYHNNNNNNNNKWKGPCIDYLIPVGTLKFIFKDCLLGNLNAQFENLLNRKTAEAEEQARDVLYVLLLSI